MVSTLARRSNRWLLNGLVLAAGAGLPLASGCSAIVNPDPTRLGGTDTGGMLDVGPTDAPVPDGAIPDAGADAFVPECVRDETCDDGIDCTDDLCRGGECTFVAHDDRCAADERCSDTAGCVPILCTEDAECIDANMCNGVETCDPGGPGADARTGCVAGTAPVCDDGLTCTDDRCDDGMGCVVDRVHTRCDDGVPCTVDSCTATAGPTGCENMPDDASCNGPCTTGATCAADGCTDGMPVDCDDDTECTVDSCDPAGREACQHDPLDADGDTFPAVRAPDGNACAGGTDCDDDDPDVHPGAVEECNGRDDDCSGVADEGCPTVPDDCGSAVEIPLTGGMGSVTAAFSAVTHDYPACGGTGRDAVYYIDLTAGSDVRIDTVGSAVADTVLAVSTSCTGAAFAAQCNDDQDPSSVLTSRVWLHNYGPRIAGGEPVRVYILVQSYAAAPTANYTVRVNVTSPARADTCGVEGRTPLDITGGGLVIGIANGVTGSVTERGSCDMSTTSGREALFRTDAPSDGQIWSIEGRSSTFRPLVFTRGVGGASCSDEDDETSCDVGDAGLARVENVPASGGATFIYLDGGGVTGNTYTLAFDP